MPEPWRIWRRNYVLPSEPGAGQGVIDDLLAELERQQWGDHDTFGIHLAVEEALANAIKHGNQFDQAKHMKVVCCIRPERCFIEITDEGPGFDPSAVPDPTEPAQLDVPSGRGLMLMWSFM